MYIQAKNYRLKVKPEFTDEQNIKTITELLSNTWFKKSP